MVYNNNNIDTAELTPDEIRELFESDESDTEFEGF